MISLLRNYFIFALLVPTAYLWSPKHNLGRNAVCRSRECRERGDWYYRNMNKLAMPCEDFYEYACGSWDQVHEPPNYALEWNVQQTMTIKTLSNMRKLLEEPIKESELVLQQKAKFAYQLCISRPSLKRGNIDHVNNYVHAATSVAKGAPWVTHDEFLRVSGQSAFFEFVVMVDPKDSYRPIIQFTEPPSAYGSILHDPDWTDSERENYEDFILDIYKALAAKGKQEFNEQRYRPSIRRLFNFREDLNEIIYKSTLAQDEKFQPMKVNDVRKWYEGLMKHTLRSRINWRGIMNILYSNVPRSVIDSRNTVSLRTKDYFVDLAILLNSTPLETINDHIIIHFIERHLIYPERMIDKLECALQSNSLLKYLRGDTPRWTSCIEEHDMPHVLGQMYMEAYFEKNTTQYVKEMTKGLQMIVVEKVKESNWLTPDMKKRATASVKTIRTSVGGPEWYFRPDKKVIENQQSPLMCNAEFYLKENRVYVTAGLLQSPIFDLKVPSVLNVGSLGFIIAHTIYRVFGNCGRDPESGKKLSWWSDKSVKKCDVIKFLFLNDVNNSPEGTKKALDVKAADVNQMDISRTFVEDVSDIMGLQAAYDYHDNLHWEKCELLPHFEGYNCDQMFFIAFANSLCGGNSPHAQQNRRRERINNAVMNINHFARAFECPLHTPMNPYRRRNFWKM